MDDCLSVLGVVHMGKSGQTWRKRVEEFQVHSIKTSNKIWRHFKFKNINKLVMLTSNCSHNACNMLRTWNSAYTV